LKGLTLVFKEISIFSQRSVPSFRSPADLRDAVGQETKRLYLFPADSFKGYPQGATQLNHSAPFLYLKN
jgi:hypothetical protein